LHHSTKCWYHTSSHSVERNERRPWSPSEMAATSTPVPGLQNNTVALLYLPWSTTEASLSELLVGVMNTLLLSLTTAVLTGAAEVCRVSAAVQSLGSVSWHCLAQIQCESGLHRCHQKLKWAVS
jgi:hypothetical protein